MRSRSVPIVLSLFLLGPFSARQDELCAAQSDPEAAARRPVGAIEGTVVNGSQGMLPLPNVDVALRVVEGVRFAGIARTRSDASGRFRFEEVPVTAELVYLPGATWQGIHYPGPRVRLDRAQMRPRVRVVVFDSVSGTSPLIMPIHEVTIRVRPHDLVVREEVTVANESRFSYVSPRAGSDSVATTLKLGIPASFTKVTFDTEKWGRRFTLVDDCPATDIPWPPGVRRLAFTYTIPRVAAGPLWRRTVDLPCRRMSVRVAGQDSDAVEVSVEGLAGRMVRSPQDPRQFVGSDLPAGAHVLLRLPAARSITVMGRRTLGITLLLVVCAAVVVLARRG